MLDKLNKLQQTYIVAYIVNIGQIYVDIFPLPLSNFNPKCFKNSRLVSSVPRIGGVGLYLSVSSGEVGVKVGSVIYRE